ncbi:MAG: hypothetical protein AAF533_01750 [Acidobacteriota bacterium]
MKPWPWKSWLVLLLVIVALVAGHSRLQSSARQSRAASAIGHPIPKETSESWTLAGLSVETPDGRTVYYANDGAQWRCLSYHGVIVDEGARGALVNALLGGEGVVRSTDPRRAADFGFFGRTWRVRFHGPNMMKDPGRDVLHAMELGKPTPGAGGYVRAVDAREIWSIDTDPWSPLSAGERRLPLLDPHVIPQSWPGPGGRVDRIEVAPASGSPHTLVRVSLERTPQELRAGLPGHAWKIERGSHRQDTGSQVESFARFIGRIPWSVAVDPTQASELGMDRPIARLRLHPREGAPAEIRVGAPVESGEIPVQNTATGCLFLLPPYFVDLIAPPAAVLQPGHGDPWTGGGGTAGTPSPGGAQRR